jgi:hypothetical protein
MRFLCLYRSGKPETAAPPSPDEIRRLGQLLYDMTIAGALVAGEGLLESLHGVRLRQHHGEVIADDGPFKDIERIVSSVFFVRAKTKEDAVVWGKKLLDALGGGELELRLMREQMIQQTEARS